jgi:hypothetical protein
MSVAATTAVWRYSQAPDTIGLLILLALADWCDDEGYCFPSRRAICAKTGASLTTVKRKLHAARTRQELERVSVKGRAAPSPREFIGRTGFQPTNVYRLTLVDKLGTKRPEVLARNSGVRQAPLSDRRGALKRGHGGSEGGATADQKVGPGPSASLLTDTSDDTSVDTSVVKAGALPPPAGEETTEDPEQNLGVITRLAHDVLDVYGEVPGLDYADLVDAVKGRCAFFHVAYNSGVVTRALESALYQRRRAGKSSVLAGSAGEAAARLQGGSG